MPSHSAAPLADVPLEDCPIARAVDVIGDRWTLLILRSAFHGVRRFGDFQRDLEASRSVLADRLGKAVAAGLLRRVPYSEPGQRPREEYALTRKGVSLLPALVALMEWGGAHAPSSTGSVRLTAGPDGEPVHVAFVTSSGREVTDYRDLKADWRSTRAQD